MAAGLHRWPITATKAPLVKDASGPFASKRGEFKAWIANCEGAVESGRSLHRSRLHESRYRAVPVRQ
jgi:hypothetical protein